MMWGRWDGLTHTPKHMPCTYIVKSREKMKEKKSRFSSPRAGRVRVTYPPRSFVASQDSQERGVNVENIREARLFTLLLGCFFFC